MDLESSQGYLGRGLYSRRSVSSILVQKREMRLWLRLKMDVTVEWMSDET